MSSLRDLISDRIRSDGPISFAEFMDLALYHPKLGYYARAAQQTGRAGDFFTSVDVGPIFGELLAKQIAEMRELIEKNGRRKGSSGFFPRSRMEKPTRPLFSPTPFDLVEAGSGNGRLAKDVLDALERIDPETYSTTRLSLVERSAAAREAQQAMLGRHEKLLHHTSASMPDQVNGVIFANELLDALPTHAVVMTDSGLREVFVDDKDGQFVEHLEEPSSPHITEYLSRAGAELAPGWRAEVNLAAEDWVTQAAASLECGFLMIIDYGHDERELYGSSHSAGTLTTFKSHTTFADSLQTPGECDITAHVDLTAVKRAAERAGLTTLGVLDQTYFLLGVGMNEIMSVDQTMDPAALRRRLALKTLLLPGGLGSTHKVLLFGKNVGHPRLLGLSYKQRA